MYKNQIFGKLILTSLMVLLSSMAFGQNILPSLGSSRSGTSGFQFLKIPVDARAASMGNSSVADAFDGSALYWNPALASQLNKDQLFMAHTAYFDDISLNYLSFTKKLRNRTIGISLLHLDSGDIIETTEFNPFGTGRTFRTSHMAVGLTYAQNLTTLFSYGVSAKYLMEKIESVTSELVVIDLGFFYRVGDTGLRFAVGINNFGLDATPSGKTSRIALNGVVEESIFEDVSPPTTFILGTAYDLLVRDNYSVIFTGQLSNPSDNSERLSVGSELRYMNFLSARTGYQFGVDESVLPSFGVGFNLPVQFLRMGFDYGFSSRERLGHLHRLALRIDI